MIIHLSILVMKKFNVIHAGGELLQMNAVTVNIVHLASIKMWITTNHTQINQLRQKATKTQASLSKSKNARFVRQVVMHKKCLS